MAGSRLGVAEAGRHRRRLPASATVASLLLVTAALAAVGLRTTTGHLVARHDAVVASTALAMGVRSATM